MLLCLVTKKGPTLQLHALQHARLPCPSPSPRICPKSCPMSWLRYLNILSSATLFSFCFQSFLTSGSFPMSQLFASSGQSVRVSTTAFPMNTQGWFPLELTGLIFLQSKSLLQHHNSKASILWHSAFFMVQLSHLYVTTGKTIALTIWTFAGKVMSVLFYFFFIYF